MPDGFCALLSKMVPRFPIVSRSRLPVTLVLPPSAALGQPRPQQTPPSSTAAAPETAGGEPRNHVSNPSLAPSSRVSPQILTCVDSGERCLRVRVYEFRSRVALGRKAEGPDFALGPSRPRCPSVTGPPSLPMPRRPHDDKLSVLAAATAVLAVGAAALDGGGEDSRSYRSSRLGGRFGGGCKSSPHCRESFRTAPLAKIQVFMVVSSLSSFALKSS